MSSLRRTPTLPLFPPRLLLCSATRFGVVDAVYAVFALAMGAASLYAPPGRDQGVFAYVAREWLHGRWPYRDTFDLKPPAIHAVYALAIAVFGSNTYAIRIPDLFALVALSWAATRLASARPRAGTIGVTLFGTTLFYFGYFNFWDSAQCELGCATCAIAAVCAAERARPMTLAAAASGVLLAVATLFKPSAILVFPLVAGLLQRRSRQEGFSLRFRITWPLLAVVAAGAVFLIVGSIFAAHSALRPMVALLSNNAYYVWHGSVIHSWGDLGRQLWYATRVFGLLIAALVAMITFAVTRRVRGRRDVSLLTQGLPFALFLVAIAGVVIQGRFYWYHWGLMTGPVAVAIAAIAEEIATWQMPRWLATTLVAVAITTIFLTSTTSAAVRPTTLWSTMKAAVKRASGAMTVDEYDALYVIGDGNHPFYSVPSAKRIAAWLRANSTVDDTVAVRAHEPEIYFYADRRFEGRFFWTTFLAVREWSPSASRDRWLEEDREVFRRAPPRFAVVPDWARSGPESEEFFLANGYERRTALEGWIILEQRPASNDRHDSRASSP